MVKDMVLTSPLDLLAVKAKTELVKVYGRRVYDDYKTGFQSKYK